MVGKTQTDEMAYSLNGENVHYGTPANPRAPGRIPGGSSSGSASAVAGGLVDFALGTDCGGSVRLPASYCGIYGIRTTHGLVPVDGVVDLAASFDTVGWFARDAKTMQQVGEVLLPPASDFVPKRLLIAEDAFALAGQEITAALAPAVTQLKTLFAHHRDVRSLHGRSRGVVRHFPYLARRRNPATPRRLDRCMQSKLRTRHRRTLPLDANNRSGRGRARTAAPRGCSPSHGLASRQRCRAVLADGAWHRAENWDAGRRA